jgi:glycosyltransferase involved in cell wall biosynthesis
MTRWAVLTGEYPPDPGGVSDYTRLVARGLAAAGDSVRVFAPPRRGKGDAVDPGVAVHRLLGRFGPRSLAELERLLMREPRPDRILVQYVPHAFGFKAMNLPFALWVAKRFRRTAPVWVMFHEVVFPFRWWPATHAVLGAATRVMARLVAAAADRVFVSIPAWGGLLRRISPRAKPAEWLPVPCNVATAAEPEEVADVRAAHAPAGPLVGHFGTFAPPITALLAPAVSALLELRPDVRVLLIGRQSDRYRAELPPALADRVSATGDLPPGAVAAHLRACDLVLQPYPDGVSARRGSVMASIANGVPVVTNLGPLSEPLWPGGAVAAAPDPDPAAIARLAARLLAGPAVLANLGRRGAALYRGTFALERTIARLRGEAR